MEDDWLVGFEEMKTLQLMVFTVVQICIMD